MLWDGSSALAGGQKTLDLKNTLVFVPTEGTFDITTDVQGGS